MPNNGMQPTPQCGAADAGRYVVDSQGIMAMGTKSEASALRIIKLVHTVVWVFFAGSIFAIPVSAALEEHRAAFVLIGIVFVEVLILVVNGMRCPLTGVAARYTDDRRDNFDIYLPEWLARHNQTVFGVLYVLGIIFAIARWAKA